MKPFLSISIFLLTISSIAGQTEVCNCCSQKHAEFDFWLGSWEVTDKDGKVVGYNEIEKIQGDCVILENWKSANGSYTGTSNNFYNNSTKQWEQIWLDNQGGSLHLKGKRIDNQMILKSDDLKNQKAEDYYNKITWTYNDDGTVRQLWQIITNDTITQIAFDGLYKKRPSEND